MAKRINTKLALYITGFVFVLFLIVGGKALLGNLFSIPTPSMSGTILPGDHIVVHQIFPESTNFLIPNWLKKVRRLDLVVFDPPKDAGTLYVSRLVGMPGDVIQGVKGRMILNGKTETQKKTFRYRYYLFCTKAPQPHLFQRFGIDEFYLNFNNALVMTSEATAGKLKQLPFVENVVLAVTPPDSINSEVLGATHTNRWNEDNFGPIQIPQKGLTIQIDSTNISTYQGVIEKFEDVNSVKLDSGKLSIDGKLVDSYTFKNDYFWAMGDNRHNSNDSRFYGFIPYKNMFGKVWGIFWSMDVNQDFGFRWERFFKSID